MRKIKFRLRIGNQVVGYEMWMPPQLEAEHGQWIYSKDNDLWNSKYITHDEKDQYIGLLNEDCKEIYGGDIIFKAGDNFFTTFKDEVGWNSDRDAWVTRSILPYEGSIGLICKVDTKHFRTIGNIYENPELLKK